MLYNNSKTKMSALVYSEEPRVSSEMFSQVVTPSNRERYSEICLKSLNVYKFSEYECEVRVHLGLTDDSGYRSVEYMSPTTNTHLYDAFVNGNDTIFTTEEVLISFMLAFINIEVDDKYYL